MTISSTHSIVVTAMLAELEDALVVLRTEMGRQEQIREHYPFIYSEIGHASSLAQMVQGIYTKSESILKLWIEETDGKLSQGSSWHAELLRVASNENPEIRGAFISKHTYVAMRELLGFRHMARSSYAEELKRDRVVAVSGETIETINSLIKDIRAFMAPVERQAQVNPERPSK